MRSNERRTDRVGQRYTTNQGDLEIIAYSTSKDCDVRFDDGTILKNIHFVHIKNGSIKNPNFRSIAGVGFQGVGKYGFTKNLNISQTWKGIIKRCYGKKESFEFPTYNNVSVCEEWHNFQNFAQWFEDNNVQGFEIDKDILIKGNKIYSPETCAFVPHEINMIFRKIQKRGRLYPTGVYKNTKKRRFQISYPLKINQDFPGYFDTPEEAWETYKKIKETHIKNLADKWKDLIDPRVYEALYNYKVEITD